MHTIRRTDSAAFRALLFVVIASAPLSAQAAGRGAAAVKPDLDSLAARPATRQSWTSDRMRFGIGDIITVLIVEHAVASANLTDNNTETRTRALGLDITPPSGPTKPAATTSVTMDFNNNGDSQKSGAATRQHDFQSQMSVRVVAISPSGVLQIRGHKLVNVDNNQQDVVVTGWIRPQDIAVGANTVESSRIADAEIDYGQRGALGSPRSGLMSRILGAIWP
jgi:flagellar L-ring protein FlgH